MKADSTDRTVTGILTAIIIIIIGVTAFMVIASTSSNPTITADDSGHTTYDDYADTVRNNQSLQK